MKITIEKSKAYEDTLKDLKSALTLEHRWEEDQEAKGYITNIIRHLDNAQEVFERLHRRIF